MTEDAIPYPKRVLVGYDGSDGAVDAVALAKVFCEAGCEQVLLVNVLPYPGPLPVSYRALDHGEGPRHESFRDAEAQLRGVETDVRTYVGGSPSHVLTDVAEDEGFDLVVIGSPHRGMIGRALIGSVAQGLLHGCKVATVCAPRGYAKKATTSFRTIAVGYDGSREADAALRRARTLARAAGAEIELITVATPPRAAGSPWTGPLPPTVPDSGAINRQGIERISGDIAKHGKEYFGAAAERLAVASRHADLLVVGSRAYGPIARVMLGSVSTRLIHLATCPVLVVPRPKASTESADEPPKVADGAAAG